jgi:hypothetical protein
LQISRFTASTSTDDNAAGAISDKQDIQFISRRFLSEATSLPMAASFARQGKHHKKRLIWQTNETFKWWCAGHGTILAGESPATGGYRQVYRTASR